MPFDGSVGALAELRDEGKVERIGQSNVDVDQLAAARVVAPIAAVQNRCNRLYRSSEPVLARCEQEGIGFLP